MPVVAEEAAAAAATDERPGPIPRELSRESQFPGSSAEPATAELETADHELPKVLAALRHQDFRIMWAGNFLSNIGTWMQNIAQAWLVLELTDSAFWLGVVSFAAAAPLLVFTLFGGVIADRVDKRRLLIATQIAMMLSAFALAGLSWFHVVRVGHIVFLAFVTGLASALSAPSYQAVVPKLVPREELVNAVGLNSAQFNMSRVLGPTLGGFGMSLLGVAGNFFLNGLSFLAVIFSLHKIKMPAEPAPDERGFWENLREGFRYVFGNHKTNILVILVSVIALFGIPYLSFVPVFARSELGVGERGLGLLMAFAGLGAFCAAVTVAYLHRIRRRGRWILAGSVVFFASVIGFTLSRRFVLSALLTMTAGFALIFVIAIINTRLQHLADDELRGRTMSIYATAYLGLPPIGALAIGWLSDKIGTPWSVAAMATAGLALCLTTLAIRRDLLRLD